MDADAAAQPTLEVGMLVSHYRIQKLIARGDMGDAYLALDTNSFRNVAMMILKLRPGLSLPIRWAFGTNVVARQLAQTPNEHPNLPRFFDCGYEEHAGMFFTTEYLIGMSLDDWIAEYSPLELDQALEIAREITAAVQRLHERGIVHCAINPGNVMLCRDGVFGRRSVLIDFGLASIPDEANTQVRGFLLGCDALGRCETSPEKPSTRYVIGCTSYNAPESNIDCHLSDQRSDLYSLGLVLYELFTGVQVLPTGKKLQTLVEFQKVLDGEIIPPKLLREIMPQELADLIIDMLKFNPEERPQSVSQVLKVLSEDIKLDQTLAHVTEWPSDPYFRA